MAEKFLGNVRGRDAQQPNFSFVTPDTLPSGSQATIQNLGSPQNPVLKFGIPAGSQGAPGSAGRNGVDGKDGQSITGPRGRAATLKINSIEMLDSDADPEVISIGNETDAEYILRLPRAVGSVVDEELISDSTNPVQSKAIQEALALKADSSSIPTKVSELTNDRNYVSETSVNVMIEDAVEAAAIAANPVDDEFSDTSVNAVQNKVVNSALAEKVEMEITDAIDNNNTPYGEIVTLRNKDREVSMVLTGDNIESVVLSQNFAERIPTIVSELPTEGSLDRLYLVPSSGDNYSMHIWMEVDGVEKWVNIQSGSEGQASVYDEYRVIQMDSSDYTESQSITIVDPRIVLSVLNNKVIGCFAVFRFLIDFAFRGNTSTNLATNINLNKYGLELSDSILFGRTPFSLHINGPLNSYNYTSSIIYDNIINRENVKLTLSRVTLDTSEETVSANTLAYVSIGTFL